MIFVILISLAAWHSYSNMRPVLHPLQSTVLRHAIFPVQKCFPCGLFQLCSATRIAQFHCPSPGDLDAKDWLHFISNLQNNPAFSTCHNLGWF